MNIDFYCTPWGSNDLSFEEFCIKAKRASYNGVEMSLRGDELNEHRNKLDLLSKHDLKFIAVHSETTSPVFNEHKQAYDKALDKLLSFGPEFVCSQTGRDIFNFEQNMELLDLAEEKAKRSGINIVHETHRGRFSYAPHVTRAYLQESKDLKLALDISHWCTVAESMLDDQADTVSLALKHTHHIHARVGHSQGPQISDPKAPEWKNALNIHVSWWDEVMERVNLEEYKNFTVTPEFGAAPYMPTLPFKQVPLTDQWKANEYMMALFKDRYLFQ